MESLAIGQAFREPPMSSDGSRCAPTHELAREAAAVQLQDRWGYFCRQLILRSAVGGASTADGHFIAVSGDGVGSALVRLRATYKSKNIQASRDWEPKWYDPDESIAAGRKLGLANFSTIAFAIGSTPSPLEDLRAVRNFFAHRGVRAAVTMGNRVGLTSTGEAHSHLTELQLGGIPRFEAWIVALQSMAAAAVR